MNKLNTILSNQFLPDHKTCQILIDISNSEINKEQRIKYRSLLPTFIDCYQYGVIEGKRQERAKHKSSGKK